MLFEAWETVFEYRYGIGVALFIVWFFWWGFSNDRREAAEEVKTKAAYRESLEKLREDPTSNDLREKVLACGRAWNNALIPISGAGYKSEMSIRNDIDAVCMTPQQTVASVQERLTILQELLDSGSITNAEYASRRSEILEQI